MMVQANAGRALLHAALKRGILESEDQRDRLQLVFDDQGLFTTDRLRAWLDAGQGIDPATGRHLARCLAPADAPQLGSYTQLALLEEGGMGSVGLASDPEGQLVVIKTMKKQLAGVEEYIKRFEREIAFMRELRHPSLVGCLDAGVAADGTPFLVLEFIPGGTLKQLAERRGVPEELALSMIYQVLAALDYVSDRHLVHRDIKPANIFVDGERAVLADFGLARSTADDATSLTMEGSLVGTPHYMSPEQIQPDAPLDARCDLYALGAVLYFALTGRDPYSGQRYEVMHAHCSAAVPEVRKVNDAVSKGTEQIIVKAMQKKPSSRYPCASAMLRVVESQLRELGVDPAGIDRRVAEMLAARQTQSDPLAVTQATMIAGRGPEDPTPQHGSEVLGDQPGSGSGATPPPVTARTPLPDTATPLPDTATPVPDSATPTADAAIPTHRPEGPEVDPTVRTSDTLTAVGGDEPSRHSQVTMFTDLQAEAEGAGVDTGTGRHEPDSGVGRSGTDADIRRDTPTPGGGSGTRVGSGSGTRVGSGGSSETANFERALEDPLSRTPRDPVPDVGSAVIGDRFVGDIASASARDWLTLTEVGGERRILVWARRALVMGKMRQEPVDLCLRNYPVSVHKEACQRVSRQHARLSLVERQVVLEDLGSANGSNYDGYPLMANKPMAIAPGPEHLFVASDTISLRIRVTHRSGEVMTELPGLAGALAAGPCGLDADHDYDAVVITRPENAHDFAYAMVLRRISVGGPGADLLVHDASGGEVVDLACWGGRWIRRRGGQSHGAWGPLAEGDSFVAGGCTFVVQPGDYRDFH